MRVMGRLQFMAQPAGVIFSYWEPCAHYGLFRKGDNCGTTDYFQADMLPWSDDPDIPPAFDPCVESRDGCYNAAQLYAVYEREDLEAFAALLLAAPHGPPDH